jgi:predicted glycoside hydrolase/deacetylase ChbG (UPF0249 family)
MTRVIFTADDYGAVPSIDQGIINAVKAGKINSVAAFTNSPRSLSSIQTLISEAENSGNPVEIGCHLTITSGRPLTGGVKWLTKRGYFRKYSDFKRPTKLTKRQAIDLEGELKAQIAVLQDKGIAVKHLSSHHGTLTWFEDFTEMLFKIGDELSIPVRSPHFIPEKKNNLYLIIVTHLTKLNIPIELSFAIKQFRENYTKRVNVILKSFGKQVTSFTDSSHYGPLSFRAFSLKSITNASESKRKEFQKRLTEQNEEEVVEYMFHLIDDNFGKLNKFKKQSKRGKDAYKGIDRNYFDSRMIEMKSLMELELPKGVELVSWKPV